MNLYAISVQLSANAAQFSAALKQAASDVTQFSKDVYDAAAKGNSATKLLSEGMLALGAAASAAVAAGTYAAMQLEATMQNVATLWDENQQKAQGTFVSIQQATQAMVQLSTTLPQSANTLAQGLYDVASSGFQGSDAITVLTASAKAASAGLTDTATAARGITAVLNAYGQSAGDATKISDILFQTVNLGIVTFPQLSNVLGDFVGLTATAKIPFEEAGAALATMTLSGVTAAEAGTSLNRVIKAILKPSQEMSAILQSLGYESGAAALQTDGLQGVMTKLAGVVGYDNVNAWIKLFPEIRATRGALALIANDGENFSRVASKMTDDTELLGATQRALDKQSQSTSFQLNLLKNQVVALGIGFGQALLPVIKDAISVLQAVTQIFSSMPDGVKTAVIVAGLLATAVVALGGAFLFLAPKITAAIALINSSTTASYLAVGAMDALSAAMPVIGAITAVVTVATPFILKWADSHAQAKKRVDDLKSSLDQETGAFTANTAEVVRNQIVKGDLANKASAYGIDLGTLTKAMLGDKDALAQVNSKLDDAKKNLDSVFGEKVPKGGTAAADLYAKINDVRNAINGQNKDLAAAQKAWSDDQIIKGAVASATNDVTAASQQQAQAQQDAIDKANEEADALKALNKELTKLLDPMQAYTDGMDKLKAKESDQRNDESASIDTWANTLKRALEDTETAKQRAMDDDFTTRKRNLDAQYQALLDELDAEKQANQAAHDAEMQAQQDAFDQQERTRKEALDSQQRDEKEALDADLQLLDRDFNQRKAILQRQQNDEEDALLAQIDQLFGADRQAAIDKLFNMKNQHADQLQALSDQNDTEKQKRKDALDDQQQQEDDAYDDAKKARDEAFKAEQDAAEQHYQDMWAAKKTAIENAKQQDENALDDEKTRQQRALDDEKTQLTRALDDQIAARRAQYDKERQLASEQRPLTLAEYQKTLDAQYTQYQQHNTDMAIIAAKGGQDMSSAVMAEIGKLPPEIVHAVAGAGPDAFNAFMDAMKTRVNAEDASNLGQPIMSLFQQIGQLAGPGFAINLINSLAGDPNIAQKLQDTLLNLIAPKEISPGVWATPKPGGGYYPGRMTLTNAYGSITRQAAISSRPVLWAEAGPEAYVPLDHSKASRSVDILGQAASFYGYGLTRMAAGGLLRASGSLSTSSKGAMVDNRVTVNADIHLSVAAGVDPNAFALVARREVGRQLDRLGREIIASGGKR